MFAASKTSTASSGYQISRSLRFNSADSAYLNRTPASAGNRQTWTLSCWMKKSLANAFEVPFRAGDFVIYFSSDVLKIDDTAGTYRATTQVFRDYSAWYHFVFVLDTTNATANNRIRIYLNGSEITAFTTLTNPTQNLQLSWNNNINHNIGTFSAGTYQFGGYMTEINFIDGQALTPSSFGETNAQTGVWQPKAYSGSYGTNGFYLNFSDNSNTTAATLGKDYSGNGNNWTPNNFSVTAGAGNDSLVDSPTSYGTDTGVGGTVRGNYATLNPLDTGSGVSLTNGNLDISIGGSHAIGLGTFMFSSGKWYAEYTISTTSSGNGLVGVCCPIANRNSYLGGTNGGIGMGLGSDRWINGVNSAGGLYATAGDVIGIALDMDTSQVSFYKNGSFHSTITGSILTQPYAFAMGHANNSGIFNFGQRPFAYTAPSGYKALCTQNLPTPTIGATTATQAGKYFNPVLYTGTGASSQSITGVGFAPDFVWIKSRSSVTSHSLFDQIRGAQKWLGTNSTNSEQTYAGTLDAFGSDGFTVGNDAWTGGGNTYVAWNWKANGSGSTNSAGSITSTVSANTTSGFSVVTYTGNGTSLATVGHGLGAIPSMFIVKARSQTGYSWYVYQKDVGNTKFLELNTTAAPTTFNLWESTNPTSSVFTISNNAAVNNNGSTYVAYCFAEVAGYSKFGSYVGNGSTDGTFVYFGFRPAYVMIKASNAVDNWVIMDVARNPYNAVNYWLQAESSAAEATLTPPQFDFVSNGLKLRGTSSTCNASGVTYIYMAFASNPFKTSLAR